MTQTPQQSTQAESIVTKKNTIAFNNLLTSLTQSIADSEDKLVSIIDLDARIIYISPAYESASGLSAGECIEKSFCDIFPCNTSFHNEKKIIEQIISGKTIQREESFKLDNGTVHTYIAHKFPVKDDNNNIVAVASISTDINKFKETELKLEK